jgi:hypothetical protein
MLKRGCVEYKVSVSIGFDSDPSHLSRDEDSFLYSRRQSSISRAYDVRTYCVESCYYYIHTKYILL